jgi:polar amino acid transport system substrate-binding protein
MPYFIFAILFISGLTQANPQNSNDNDAKPTVIEVGISMSIPPWVIKEDDSGIELDLLRESLKAHPYQITPVYMPFERAYKQFEAGELDVVMNAKEGVSKTGFLSQPVVTFQNYAISLASKDYPLDIPMSFLEDKTVVGFQKARHFLGEQYAQMAAKNKRYHEVPKQALQINLLFIREQDFIVMDKSIFGYYWYQATQSKPHSRQAQKRFMQSVRFHPLFPESPYPFLFNNKQVRDDFDEGLAEIKADGRYQMVIDKYNHLSDLYQSPVSP